MHTRNLNIQMEHNKFSHMWLFKPGGYNLSLLHPKQNLGTKKASLLLSWNVLKLYL